MKNLPALPILRRVPGLLALFLLLLLLLPARALADDLADEADLRFQLGAERYKADDYQGALEHFLASNRLVPNRNVLFNIGRSFEKLKRYADAHRYYVQALEGEQSPAGRARVEESIKRLQPSVALLEVTTTPSGATIYIDRKDLGPRGTAPRLLAFPEGKHRILVELEGCEPASSELVELKTGTVTRVALELRRILGTVKLEAGPPGTTVTVDDEAAAPAGTLPLELQLPPGRHALFLKHPGYRTATVAVEVEEQKTVTVRPELTAITGTLVVNADEAEALIEVDGKTMGYAPAVLQVPVGSRTVRVSRPGFRDSTSNVVVTAGQESRLDVELRVVEEVTAASRQTESVEDAAASVSIISGNELRAMGYPTLVEALRGTRGLYVSDDRTYAAVGIRGLARPGDYGNRVLVLLDGMPTNDDWIGSSYIGFDLRTDLEDVQRIEVVRGAGSVLYGTGAVSGIVNLVPRGPESAEGVEAGVSTSEYGVAHLRASGTAKFSETAGFWTSFGAARGMGRDIEVPELLGSETAPDGILRGMDGFDAGMLTGRGWAGDFNLQFSLNVRDKRLAVPFAEAKTGDPRNRYVDTRGLVELRHEPTLGRNVRLLSRAFVNHYSFLGEIAYEVADGGLSREEYYGTWFGLEERVVLTPMDSLQLTLGGEAQLHTDVHQIGQDDTGVYLDRKDPFQIGAGYLLVDVEPSELVKLSAGARLDAYSTFGTSLNPRAAVVVHPAEGNTVKLIGGKAFRAPSVYEIFYTSSVQVESPELGPETMYTGELEVSQRLGKSWTALATGFGNFIEGLVVQRGEGSEEDPLRYENSELPILTLGGEAELRREWRQGFMAAVSYSYQHSRYQHAEGELREVPNSPEHLASARGAVPLIARSVFGATRLSFEGPRWDRYEQEIDPQQRRTRAALIWDVVISGKNERLGVDWSAGVYNAFDYVYESPISGEYTQRTMVQNGRTLLLSAAIAL